MAYWEASLSVISSTAVTARDLLRSRVRAVMARKRLTPLALARAIKKSQPWASQFLSGSRDVPVKTAEDIAAFLGVPLWELFAPDGVSDELGAAEASLPPVREYMRRGIDLSAGEQTEFLRLPVLSGHIAAGEPLTLSGEPDSYLSFRADFASRFTAPILMRVGKREESMFPEIYPDDLVAMDQADSKRLKVQPGRIYVLNLDGGGTLKHAELVDGHLVITARNPDRARYRTRIESVRDDQSILDIVKGEVVWIGRYVGSGRDKR